MTAGTEIGRFIVSVDLRGSDPTALTSRRFSEVQAEAAPGGDGDQVDFRRVILVDGAAELAAHDEVYAHILDSHIDVSIVCLAIGPPPADDPIVALRRPQLLGPPKVATLWIGDPHGIGWRMGSALADRVNVPGKDAARGGADAIPHELIEILSLPEVFDRVVELVGAMPGAVASPGFSVVRGNIAPDAMADAQRSAIRQLTNLASGATKLPSAANPDGASAGPEKRGTRTSDVIRPGGRVDDLYQRSRKAGRDATTIVRRVTGVGGLTGANEPAARRALSQFADALSELNELVGWTLDHVDTRTGFEAAHRQDLDDVGIELDGPTPATPANTVQALTEQTLAAIDQCQPLPAIAERLRDESDKMVPQGTEAYRDRLRRICPPSLFTRLRTPPAFITGVPPAWLLAATFVACLLSGVWPKPFGLFGGLAVLAAAVVAAWVMSRAAAVAAVSRPAAGRFFAGHLAAAVIGAVCGLALSKVAKIPAPAGPAGLGIGAVITIILLLALAAFCWRSLAAHWSVALQLSRATGVPDTVRALVVDVTRSEWRLAAVRTADSDRARVIAGIVDDAAATLRSYADKLPNRASQQRSDHDQARQDLVTIDLAAAVATALDRLTLARGAAGLATVDSQAVQDEVTALLDTYRVHLMTVGVQEPPPFTRPSERRAILVESLDEHGSALEQAVRPTITDERLTQLCAPEQLTLLETRADLAQLIRFAPRSAQGLVGQQALGTRWEQPVRWTWASPIAGVLRLVPLRASAVETIMPKSPGTPELTYDSDGGMVDD